jgi:hypothetical protein
MAPEEEKRQMLLKSRIHTFREDIISRTQEVQIHRDREKKAEQVRTKVKAIFVILFDIRGVLKEVVLS